MSGDVGPIIGLIVLVLLLLSMGMLGEVLGAFGEAGQAFCPDSGPYKNYWPWC